MPFQVVNKSLNLLGISVLAFVLMYSVSAQAAYDMTQSPTQLFVLPTMQQSIQQVSYSNLADEHLPLVLAAEELALPAAQRVLKQARWMSLEQRAIVSGGCWDYLNAVFNAANVKRDVLFKGDIHQGPYAAADQLRAGDWIYYINHGYHDIEHSGMFIGWVDEASRQALILSYAGERRQEPARYKVYDVSHVYQIMRPS